MAEASHTLRTLESLESVTDENWQRLCAADFPFYDKAFLRALEISGAVGVEAGWQPCHLTAWQGDQLTGACPLYLKDNSYGEYIFDWAWARAYQEHRLPYYPKLVAAVPFTPATGAKLLTAPGEDDVRPFLIAGARQLVDTFQASSLHFLFISAEEIPLFEAQGFSVRHSYQYHWRNAGFASFDAFLDDFRAPKRKQIRKERREVEGHGLQIRQVSGGAISAEHAALFYRFYLFTIEKMSAIPYLNEAFFQRVFETQSENVVLFLAEKDAVPVAGSLCFKKGNALFGRYWGALDAYRSLHFELCYYRPIEYAIENGLALFEAGAQGEHKIARGFLPTVTHSAHWIQHPGFRSAIAVFIEQEKAQIRAYFQELASHSPLK